MCVGCVNIGEKKVVQISGGGSPGQKPQNGRIKFLNSLILDFRALKKSFYRTPK